MKRTTSLSASLDEANIQYLETTISNANSDKEKLSAAKSWFINHKNNITNFEQFKQRIIPIIGHNNRDAIIKIWFLRPQNNIPVFEDFSKSVLSLFEHEGENEEDKRIFFTRIWFAKPANHNFDNLRAILFTYQNDPIGVGLVKEWLEKKNIDFADLQGQILRLFTIGQVERILETWFNKAENRTLENFTKILPLIEDSESKISLATSLIRNSANEDDLLEVLSEALPVFNLDFDNGEVKKYNIVFEALVDIEDVEKRYQTFINILELDLIDGLRVDLLVDICRKLALDEEEIIGLNYVLYQNDENLKVKFLKECVSKQILIDTETTLRSFATLISSLREDDNVKEFLDHLQDNWNLNYDQAFDLVINRLGTQYKYMAAILCHDASLSSPYSLREALTADALAELEMVNEDNNSPPLSNLFAFAFYDDTDEEFEEVIAMIKPDILREIAANFSKISDQSPYISLAEYSWINLLLNNSIELPKTDLLCDFFAKMVDIPKLTNDEIRSRKINFTNTFFAGDSSLAGQVKRGQLDHLFHALFTAERVSQDQIISFFGEIQGEDGQEFIGKISDYDKMKLRDFFNRNKNELACLLTSENGLATFLSCLSCLDDGCVHNLGSQFRIALYSSLLKDSNVSAAYLLFIDSIVTPMLNIGGVDVINLESDPLKNMIIRDGLIAPIPFLKALRNEFVNESGKTNKYNAWNFLEKELGDKNIDELLVKKVLYEKLEELASEKMDDSVTDLACYLVLQRCAAKEESMPEGRRFFAKILSNESLRDFAAHNKILLEAVEKEVAERKAKTIPSDTLEPSKAQRIKSDKPTQQEH